MAFCHNCGAKIEDGDLFCMSCGAKQIQESTQEEVEEEVEEELKQKSLKQEQVKGDVKQENLKQENVKEGQAEQQREQVKPDEQKDNGYKQNYKGYTKNKNVSNNRKNISFTDNIFTKMLIKPVTTSKEFVENGNKNTIIELSVIMILLQGLIGVWKLNQIFNCLQKSVIGFIEKINNFMNLFGTSSNNDFVGSSGITDITNEFNKVRAFLRLPYGKIFIESCLLIIVAVIIIFLVTYIASNMLSKVKIQVSRIYKIALISIVPMVYFEILAIIFSYISSLIGIVIFASGIIVSLVCLGILIKEKLPIDENHSVFIVALIYILVSICIFVCCGKIIYAHITDIIQSIRDIILDLKVY
ncbi:zinc ribbon domain-containing protein [Haloimpatiens sp. FM7330]|uniref:zinc ribbon domain-containing protein n=1 Tax=Haloimpatiens sp. FM7330 TaxID=3298610 RepID=UPI00362C2FE2